MKTSIEWCDHSINPLRARHKKTGKVGHYCEKIAAGCKHCYSSKMQVRFGTPEFGGGQLRDEYELFLDESKLAEVRRRKRPTKYFWCDMTDLFGDWVLPEWLEAIYATIDATPQHIHMLLTKRPSNIRRLVAPKYRENVWLGASVSDQETANVLIPELLKCRDLSPVLFLSAEPLLGRVRLTSVGHIPADEEGPNRIGYMAGPDDGTSGLFVTSEEALKRSGIGWVIVGGESGPGARPCNVDWVRSIRDQCQTAGVPVFIKQMGFTTVCPEETIEAIASKTSEIYRWPEGTHFGNRTGNPAYNGRQILLKDRKGGDWEEWPDEFRVREIPA